MEAWQGRVLTEKADLDENLAKLDIFLNSGGYLALGDEGRVLLQLQYHHMKNYADILAKRIERFKVTA